MHVYTGMCKMIVDNSSQVAEPLRARLEADGVMVFEKLFNTDDGIQSLGDEPFVSHCFLPVQDHGMNETL